MDIQKYSEIFRKNTSHSFCKYLLNSNHVLGTVLNDKDIVMNLPMDPIISRILRRAHLGSQCCFQLPECPLHAQLQRQILSKTNELQSSWLLAFMGPLFCVSSSGFGTHGYTDPAPARGLSSISWSTGKISGLLGTPEILLAPSDILYYMGASPSTLSPILASRRFWLKCCSPIRAPFALQPPPPAQD